MAGRNGLLRKWLLSDSLNFTLYFFREMNSGNDFVVGPHHRLICNKLNDVFQGKCNRLMINIAPRYSKTELAVKNFISMGLAINPNAQFIHLSYSDSLVQDNSLGIKDIMNSEAYRSIFPTRIKPNADTKKQWSTTEGGGLYATSTLGQITGFGAGRVDVPGHKKIFNGAIIIDDPIKPEDALSDVEREKVNRRFETTIRNRVNSRNTPIIIIMQRLHENDLCGYLQNQEPYKWEVLSIPCMSFDKNGKEKALWPFKHTVKELYEIKAANSFVFETQYMQNPKPLEGLMYREFKTYELIPIFKGSMRKLCNYTDTADTGADYLCSICYVELPEGNFVLDVLYTKKPMEYTEQATAQMLTKHKIEYCHIESNNGGRGFRRNVERLCREMGNTKTFFNDFTQTQNKQVRIFTHSNDVNNITFFPKDWEKRWPEFANAIKSYRKEGRNAHDDAPDALTGMFEKRGSGRYLTDEEILNILY